MRWNKLIALSLLAYFILVGGSCPKTIKTDLEGTIKIARQSEQYLSGCPDFFIPPVEGSSGNLQNQSGAVGWCPTMVVGNPANTEKKSNYITRLNLAKVQNQINWAQYQQIYGSPTSGYPGYYYMNGQQIVLVPERTYQAGFICYSLVYNY